MAAPGIRILSLDQLVHLPEPEWLIEGLLERGSLATLYGPSDSGKSFVAIGMACCVAGLGNWCSRPTGHGDVVYVCAEGSAGVARRIRACCHDAHRPLPDRFYVIPQPVEVSSEDAVKEVRLMVEELGINPMLIVIDTLA
jgi:putative DNA primase/helicase